MKHFWAGILLLTVLLGLGIWSSQVLEQIHAPIEQDLNAAADAALAKDWEQATVLLRRAAAAWEQNRNWVAALSDHCSIEAMDILFRRLEVYSAFRDAQTYAAACRELACFAAASTEAHKLTWWNML